MKPIEIEYLTACQRYVEATRARKMFRDSVSKFIMSVLKKNDMKPLDVDITLFPELLPETSMIANPKVERIWYDDDQKQLLFDLDGCEFPIFGLSDHEFKQIIDHLYNEDSM